MEKPFSLGILVGRFQTLHSGHEQMIETALALCRKVGIFVGSSQESGTRKNPFPFELRREMLRALFDDRVEIYPLPDIGVGNVGAWGDYVLENVQKQFGQMPELLISGKETRRLDWFDSVQGVRVAELYIPKTIEISASQMREYLLTDDRQQWNCYVDPKIHPFYPRLRALVLESEDRLETQSI